MAAPPPRWWEGPAIGFFLLLAACAYVCFRHLPSLACAHAGLHVGGPAGRGRRLLLHAVPHRLAAAVFFTWFQCWGRMCAVAAAVVPHRHAGEVCCLPVRHVVWCRASTMFDPDDANDDVLLSSDVRPQVDLRRRTAVSKNACTGIIAISKQLKHPLPYLCACLPACALIRESAVAWVGGCSWAVGGRGPSQGCVTLHMTPS